MTRGGGGGAEGARSSLKLRRVRCAKGEALVPIRILHFFGILLQGKGEKVLGMVFFWVVWGLCYAVGASGVWGNCCNFWPSP